MSNTKIVAFTDSYIAIEKSAGKIVLVPIGEEQGIFQLQLGRMIRLELQEDMITARCEKGFEICDLWYEGP